MSNSKLNNNINKSGPYSNSNNSNINNNTNNNNSNRNFNATLAGGNAIG